MATSEVTPQSPCATLHLAMQRKKLPIGVQALQKIRQSDAYYVDKTPFAVKLVEEGQAFSFPARGASGRASSLTP